MRAITSHEAEKHLLAAGILLQRGPGSRPRYPAGTACEVFEDEHEPGFSGSMGLAECFLEVEKPAHRTGGLLWLQHWDSEPGMERLFQRVRRGYGVTTDLSDAPVHLFEPAEHGEAAMLFGLVVAFEWDAFFVPSGGEYLVLTDNENFVTLVTRDAATRERFDPLLIAWEYKLVPRGRHHYCDG